MRLICADTVVHWQSYDDEHETFPEHEGTIAEFLDTMTDEGCPEAVDAVPVRRGRWRHYEGMLYCSECGTEFYDDIMEWCGDHVPKFCPNCGADMRKDGDGHESVES